MLGKQLAATCTLQRSGKVIQRTRGKRKGPTRPPVKNRTRKLTEKRTSVKRQKMNARAVKYMKHSLAPSTEAAYTRVFAEWEDYAIEEAIPILPISPIDLGNFLADIAENTGSMSKVNPAIAAVADRHLAGHLKSPTLDPSVRKMVSGIRRQFFRPARSRTSLDKELLEDAFKLIEGGGKLQD